MIIKCAWCGKEMGEKPPYEDKSITHSICDECRAKHFPEKRAKLPRGEEAERQKSEIPEAPTVYCPKENMRVPIWYCLGSLTQGRETCPYLIKAIVHGGKWAKVECKFT